MYIHNIQFKAGPHLGLEYLHVEYSTLLYSTLLYKPYLNGSSSPDATPTLMAAACRQGRAGQEAACLGQ